MILEFGDAEDDDVDEGLVVVVLEPGRAGFVEGPGWAPPSETDDSSVLLGSEVVGTALLDCTFDVRRQHSSPY